MKRKEPYVNLSWPVYILFVAVGCLLAKVVFEGLDINTIYNLKMPIYIFDILLLVYGFVSCVLFYQLGKLIFAKIAGFDITYFNFYFIGWKKENGKVRCYNGAKEGFSAKVEIVPNPSKKQNYKLVYWGGTIGLVVVAGLTYALIFGLNASKLTKAFFMVSSIFYLFSFIAYMLPVRLDNINDGFSLLLLRKYKLQDTLARNKRNLQALYDPSKEIEYYDYGENNDPFSMEGKIYNYYYAIKKGDRELLLKTAQDISENNKFVVSEEFSQIAIICQIYVLCAQKQFKEISELYWKLDSSTRKTIRNPKSLASYKVGLYIAGKVDDSKQAFYEIYDNLEKAKKNYHYPALIEAEVALIETIKNEIVEDCKNWEAPVDNTDYAATSTYANPSEITDVKEDESVVAVTELEEENKEEK